MHAGQTPSQLRCSRHNCLTCPFPPHWCIFQRPRAHACGQRLSAGARCAARAWQRALGQERWSAACGGGLPQARPQAHGLRSAGGGPADALKAAPPGWLGVLLCNTGMCVCPSLPSSLLPWFNVVSCRCPGAVCRRGAAAAARVCDAAGAAPEAGGAGGHPAHLHTRHAAQVGRPGG